VFARDVAESVARARLVAFEQGGSPDVSSHAEGAHGFARGLIAAGVDAVVGPVADVDASALEPTWLEFHRHFAAGTGAPESLRRAQLAALGDAGHQPGPWATLTVFGATQ
jgi:hypothetical protein